MKKFTIYLLFCLPLSLSTSCMDEFLDQPAQGQMTENDFLENSSSVSILTNSIYTTYREGSAWETIGSWIGDLWFGQCTAGQFPVRRRRHNIQQRGQQFQNMSGLNGGSDFLNWLWNNAYTGIGRANTALKAISEFNGIDPRQKEILEGEAPVQSGMVLLLRPEALGEGPDRPSRNPHRSRDGRPLRSPTAQRFTTRSWPIWKPDC